MYILFIKGEFIHPLNKFKSTIRTFHNGVCHMLIAKQYSERIIMSPYLVTRTVGHALPVSPPLFGNDTEYHVWRCNKLLSTRLAKSVDNNLPINLTHYQSFRLRSDAYDFWLYKAEFQFFIDQSYAHGMVD